MAKQQTIFIVEDEHTIREVVRKYLELEGMCVLEAETGPKALEILRSQEVDLILLDIMLPGLDGFTITRAVREGSGQLVTSGSVPIIMLTSRGEENDRLAGFELGVDDYIVKPFSPREVVARVKAVLRRGVTITEEQSKPLIYPNLRIDPLRHAAILNEEQITLTAKEYDLLWLLAQHPGQVFTREQLLNRIWGFEFDGDASTVTVHIRRLREKIEPDPANPTYVHTVWGVGYKFEVE